MDGLISFDIETRPRIVFGEGVMARVGTLAAAWEVERILLVTDPGIVSAGHAEHLADILRDASLHVFCFDQVHENPTTEDIDACLEVAREGDVDCIVGLGGGSSLDTAKGCNFLYTNGGRMDRYWGIGKADKPMLPMIAVPTTAGTGSECQSFALIADHVTHRKMACGDPKALPRMAVLDPTLTFTQPFQVTACTGLDALAHAIETAVTTRRHAHSQLFSREAFRLGAQALPRLLADGNDAAMRGRMQLAAAYAGTAIECSMLGAAHALANPLTARHDVVHGHAVAMMLPHVIRFNAVHTPSARTYAELAAFLTPEGLDAPHARLADWIEELLETAGLARSLAACGICRDDLDSLATSASEQWTLQFNPRPAEVSDLRAIYESALNLP